MDQREVAIWLQILQTLPHAKISASFGRLGEEGLMAMDRASQAAGGGVWIAAFGLKAGYSAARRPCVELEAK